MPLSVRYAAGTGAAVATEAGVLLAATTPAAPAVHAMWTRMAAGLDPADLLAAIVDSGLAEVASFALVLAGGPVLVRGAAQVALDGPDGQSTVTAAGLTTWSEVVLPTGVTTAVLELREPGDADIPATAGVFPADRVVLTWSGAVESADIGMADVVAEEAVAEAPVPPPPAVPPPTAAEPASEPETSVTELLEVPPPRPPRPAGPPPSAHAHPVVGVLLLGDGTRVELDRAAVLGRAPSWAGPGDRLLVAVRSPFGDVSRNHVAITVEDGRAFADDLGSTNGTLLAQPAGTEHLIRPGQPEELEPGAIITLAKDVTVTFETA